jgi:uncharacterized protein (TIGR02271 family)
MSFLGIFDDDKDTEQAVQVNEEEGNTMKLRQEEMDVSKYEVPTGEVTLHKDVIAEEQTVEVPVTHEQVVIEKRALHEPSDVPVGTEEVISMPVSEERVAVDKHTVVTGEVGLHKRAVEETRQVNETLHREEARLDVDGEPEVLSETDTQLS